ncbi:uncharacterized protein [Dysidea avara]|uniref:uncharacterized protein n=1 Tax=Dysidea avara TaxID=196820 RepID=UPI003326379E
MEMSLAGLLIMVITLNGVNSQSSFEIGLCLINGVNDISRVDRTCGSQLNTLITTRNFFDLPQSTLDEVCSTSCWDRFSPVVRRCFGANADTAELGYRLACGRQPDGDNCAQVFNDLDDDMNNNEGVCVVTTPGQCPAGCTNYLMDRMRRLGCCFGETLYLFSMFSSNRQIYLNAMEAYRTCNLPFPQPCQDVGTPTTTPPTRSTTPTTIDPRITATIPTLPTRDSSTSAAPGGWAVNGIVMIVMLMMSLMI